MAVQAFLTRSQAIGLLGIGLLVSATTSLFHAPTIPVVAASLAGGMLMASIAWLPHWQWLLSFMNILLQVVAWRLLEEQYLSLAQCLAMQIALMSGIVLFFGRTSNTSHR